MPDVCRPYSSLDFFLRLLLSPLPSTKVIRCLLIVPFPESSLNDEAGRLFMESYTEYERRVKVWVGVHASKSLSGDASCSGSSSGGKGSGTVIKGAVVKTGASAGEAGAAGGSVAASTTGTGTPAGSKKVASMAVKGGDKGDKGRSAGTGAGGGGGGGGGGVGVAKRRDEVPKVKTVKDRQKEAKKKGLKRL